MSITNGKRIELGYIENVIPLSKQEGRNAIVTLSESLLSYFFVEKVKRLMRELQHKFFANEYRSEYECIGECSSHNLLFFNLIKQLWFWITEINRQTSSFQYPFFYG